jgi:ribosomal protein S18 acetylase RimI-like enzyme
VLAAWRAAFEEDDWHGNLGDVQRLISVDHSARLFLAGVDAKIAGTLIATVNGWRGNMYRLAVLPEHRRQDIPGARGRC